MRKVLASSAAMTLGLTVALAPSGPALAAGDQFGHACLATAAAAGTIVQTAVDASNSLPGTAPADGVVTKVVFNIPADAPGSYPQKVKIFQALGGSGFKTVAETELLEITGANREFDVRVPVEAGNHVGLFGPSSGTFGCGSQKAGDKIRALDTDTAVGSSASFGSESSNVGLPVVLTTEPDADGDGYGDLSQDACPQSATTQEACPEIELDSFAVESGRSVLVLLVTNETTKVQVRAAVTIAGATYKFKQVSTTVTSGRIGQAKLTIPSALAKVLAKLPAKKSVVVKVTSTAKNILGEVTRDTTKARVHGRG